MILIRGGISRNFSNNLTKNTNTENNKVLKIASFMMKYQSQNIYIGGEKEILQLLST